MLTCIFACTKDGIIGVNGEIPWDIKEDLKFFRDQTLNKTVIMGRKTYESIGHPLPSRENIVVSSKDIDGVKTARSLAEAINISNNEDIFVIGGSKLLNEAFPKSDKIICSFVDIDSHDLGIKDSDDVTEVNLSFMEFFTLEKIEPHDMFSVYYFRS